MKNVIYILLFLPIFALAQLPEVDSFGSFTCIQPNATIEVKDFCLCKFESATINGIDIGFGNWKIWQTSFFANFFTEIFTYKGNEYCGYLIEYNCNDGTIWRRGIILNNCNIPICKPPQIATCVQGCIE